MKRRSKSCNFDNEGSFSDIIRSATNQQRALFAWPYKHIQYLQKQFLGIKITTQGNYVTLIIICHEHQNKLKWVHQFIDQTVYR